MPINVFKNDSLIEILLADGTKLTGTICYFDENAISIRQTDGTTMDISQETIAHSLYFYIGYPKEPTIIQVPSMINPNGEIYSFDGKSGFAIDNQGHKQLIHLDSFLIEDDLKSKAKTYPEKIKGEKVFLVTHNIKNSFIKKGYILSIDTIDNTIDKIISLSAKGKVDIAAEFCRELIQHKNLQKDKDLCVILNKLEAASEIIDYYKPILNNDQIEQAKREKRLRPLGRIFDITRNNDGTIKEGYIIDAASHEKIFFFGGQLLGRLAKMSDEMLTGLPVVYSISPSKDGKKYQARTILTEMKYSDAYSMAEDMHYDNTMPVNACDILRIILKQTEDEEIEQDLEEWSQGTNVQGKLWILATPKPYLGKPESLITNKNNKPASIVLERLYSHTHDEKQSMSPPEKPNITFGDNPYKKEAQEAEYTKGTAKAREERQEEKKDLALQAKNLEIQKEYDKAIDLYSKLLFDDSSKQSQKAEFIRNIINLYSIQYKNAANDIESKDITDKYRLFATNHLDGPHKLKEDDLANLDCYIQYYSDMNETIELIRLYNNKISLLEKQSKGNSEEIESLLSMTRTELAWVYLKTGREINKAKNLIIEAQKNSAYENQLGRICNAVIKEQELQTTIRNEISFTEHQPFTERNLDDEIRYWNKFVSMSGPYNKDRKIGMECFVLMSKIYTYTLKGNDVMEKILEPLSQYLVAILSRDINQYDLKKKNWLFKNVKTESGRTQYDCCIAEKLSNCLNKNGSGMWRHWKDIRLVAALSKDVAYKLCTLLYNLNANAFIEVMKQSGVNIDESATNISLIDFAKSFNEWRGYTYYEHYKTLRKTSRECVNNTADLSRCAYFLKNGLKHEDWMQQADSNIVEIMHNQLASLLTDYQHASEGSKKKLTTGNEILRRITQWREDIKANPTFLSYIVLDYLLSCITNLLNNRIVRYEDPQFDAKVISTSMVKPDGTLLIEVEITNLETKSKQVTDCQLLVLNNDVKEFKIITPPYTYDDSSNVFSGQHLIYIIRGRIPQSLYKEPEGILKMRLYYRLDNGKKKKEIDFECPFIIKIWKENSPTIDNVYIPGQIAIDQFYGRDDQVREVVSAIENPQAAPHYFIYGQKRSGKSSMLYHIKKKLEEKEKFLCIELDFSRLGNEVNKEEDIFYKILEKIRIEFLFKYNFKCKTDSNKVELPLFDLPPKTEMSIDLFCAIMESIKRSVNETTGWKEHRIVLFIDEFTTVFEWCKDKTKMVTIDFFTHWKSIQAQGLFSAVLIGQDILRSIVNVAVGNDLSGYCFMKLDYLKREDARMIVTQPIIALTGNSDIFVGDSIERILDYTASSAYYTKHVCHELIKHINSNSLEVITEADVEESIREFLKSDAHEVDIILEPLEFSGRSTKESDFSKEENRNVLQTIALGELADREYGCRRININLDDKGISDKRVDDILAELVERNVITEKYNYYKINVKLYLIWTLQQTEKSSGNV